MNFRKITSSIVIIPIVIVLGIVPMLCARREPRQPARITRIVLAEADTVSRSFLKDCGRFPNTQEELLHPPAECKALQPYIKNPLQDGWGHILNFRVDGEQLTIVSFGEDGKEGGEGSNMDQMIRVERPSTK